MSDYSAGYFYGAGFGFGVFSSLFAAVGLGLILSTWIEFCQSRTWGPVEIFACLFRTAFGIPFAGVPLFIGLSMGIWVTVATGYGLPIMFVLCRVMNINCKNPVYRDAPRHQPDNDVKVSKIDGKKPSYNSTVSERNVIIWTWLSPLNLTEYHDVLVREGYATLSDLQSITAEDLKGLGITRQMHVKKILKKIENEKSIKAGTGTNIASGENEGNSAATFHVDVDQPPPAYDDDVDAPPAYDAPPTYDDVTVY